MVFGINVCMDQYVGATFRNCAVCLILLQHSNRYVYIGHFPMFILQMVWWVGQLGQIYMYHCKHKVVILAKYFVAIVTWLLCEFKCWELKPPTLCILWISVRKIVTQLHLCFLTVYSWEEGGGPQKMKWETHLFLHVLHWVWKSVTIGMVLVAVHCIWNL